MNSMVWYPRGSETVWSAATAPIHATEDASGATVMVDMPGVDPEALDITFEAGKLDIVGKRGERVYRYSVALGSKFDPDTITAKLDKGVLTLTAKLRAEAKPRKIAIGVGTQAVIDAKG